jgi:MFS family permease
MSFVDRSHTIAKPGYGRWMVPPAALCVHLCIGQAYAFSVFNLPMTKLLGITQSTPDDWKLTDLGWIFSLAIFILGVSSAVFGRWVEEGGPRRAMFTAALCWAGGFFILAVGIYIHNLWVIYIGYGAIGGIALGIGYISPVSTLIRWFPDRPGMATGMAIMGFGGGALIAAPLSVWLMSKFATPTHVGVAETFIAMGAWQPLMIVTGVVICGQPRWSPPQRDRLCVYRRTVAESRLDQGSSARRAFLLSLWRGEPQLGTVVASGRNPPNGSPEADRLCRSRSLESFGEEVSV